MSPLAFFPLCTKIHCLCREVLLCFQTAGLILYCHYLKYTSMLYLNNFYFIWRIMVYSITINLGLDQVILQNLHQYDLLILWSNRWIILINIPISILIDLSKAFDTLWEKYQPTHFPPPSYKKKKPDQAIPP